MKNTVVYSVNFTPRASTMQSVVGIKIGQEFERWVIQSLPYLKNGYYHCDCECKCELKTKRTVSVKSLFNKRSRSCGCLKKEIHAELKYKHGHAKTKDGKPASPTYQSWESMISRCCHEGQSSYKNYGGAKNPITVCDRWQGENGFVNFLEDMGERPSLDHSLDRYPDKHGNYEPSNCRWGTEYEQMRNRKDNINITYNGKTMCLLDWSEETGIPYATLQYRYRSGWPTDEMFAPQIQRDKYSYHLGRHNLQDIKTITYNGETLTYTEWSQRTGIPRQDIVRRIQAGWKIEKVLTTPCVHRSDPYIEFNGEKLHIKEWAKRLGIGVSTLRMRLGTYGWTVERALTTPKRY